MKKTTTMGDDDDDDEIDGDDDDDDGDEIPQKRSETFPQVSRGLRWASTSIASSIRPFKFGKWETQTTPSGRCVEPFKWAGIGAYACARGRSQSWINIFF